MKRHEIYFYTLLIAVLNIPLITGSVPKTMIFSTHAIADGQLWRIFTHPFVHVSWYHLLLDGAAFFLLYMQLAEESLRKRTLYVVGCGVSSLLAVLMVLPRLDSVGYCGLSGIGHGLMAVCALEMMRNVSSNKSVQRFGGLCLVLLIGKCIFEAFTGKMFFNFVHSDLIGSPVAMSHVGGVLGGCIMYGLLQNNLRIPANLSSVKKQVCWN